MRNTNIRPEETLAEATARHRLIHTTGADERMAKETLEYVTECIEDAVCNGMYSTILTIESESDTIIVQRAGYAMAIAERMGCRSTRIHAAYLKQKRCNRITMEMALTTQSQDDLVSTWCTELEYE